MRVVRRFVHVLVIVLTLVVGATAAAVIVSQTAWFKNWLRGYIVREANLYLNGQLSIQRLGGNLFFGVELGDVGISLDGSPVVAVEDLGLNYNVFEMISKGMSVDEIRLNKPILYLRREGDTWSIARLVKKQEQEADREGPAYPIAIDAIGISDASVVVDDPVGTSGVNVPRRFDRVDAALSFKYEPVRYSIDITHVSFRGSDPAIGLNALSGGISVRDDTVYVSNLALRTEETSLTVDGTVRNYLTTPSMNVRISSDKTSLRELARVLPALAGIDLQPAYEVALEGPLDRLGLTMNVRSSAGQLRGQIVADLQSPGQSVRGDVSVRHLNLAPLVKNSKQVTDITADARVDVSARSLSDVDSMRGRVALTSPRVSLAGFEAERVHARASLTGRRVDLDGSASAYGAAATVKGQVRIPKTDAPFVYDVAGRAQHLDLRRLPANLDVPPAETDITAAYHVRGSEPSAASAMSLRHVDANFRFERSTVAGAEIEADSTASVAIRGADVSYEADAAVANVDLEHVGTAFNVPSLAADRFNTDLNGHVTASGGGKTPATMQLMAAGTLGESTLLGGRVAELAFDAAYGDDRVRFKAKGAFSGFDPAALSGKPAMQGSVAGTLDLDAELSGVSQGVSVDTIQGRGRIDLTASTIGGLTIERASIDADYQDRGGDIRQLEVVGRDLNVRASGPIALGDHGASNLTVHADTPNLETLGRLFDVPVSGIAKIDATITGNGGELQADGKAVGNNVSYGENSVLAISSTYTARVPNLEFRQATVDAETRTTFLSVAGQDINEVTAQTRYRESEVTFDAVAAQPERQLTASGALLLHPEHQEVHLERMTLTTRGQQWQLAPESFATIRYGGGETTIEHARLVSGDQSIEADGTFGRPGDALRVSLNDVDVANIDALLLREPQFTGRLNASGAITGTPDAIRGEAEFTVARGGFRQFRYDSFAGTAAYTGHGITVDTRLQQNPTQWLTAKGYVPVAVFAKKAEDEAAPTRDHEPPATPDDRIDLTIDSSPIDLGVVQGFTTALTDVTGTVEAHVRVEGSAADPHPTGAITVLQGTATIVPLGVKYQQIEGRVDLQPDRVHIDRFTVLDNHKSPLSITGDLAIHSREVGAVQIRVTSEDFKVIDNKLGNVRVRSDVALTGELRSPHVEGTIGVTTGEIKLDEVVAQLGSSPYATTPAEFTTPASDAQKEEAEAPPVFDALTVNVRVTVPDDLVVKASSLEAPGSSVGLGALNVTLGGDLTATKQAGSRVHLVGAVNTVRGNYDFQGRRFEILRDGSVRFLGADEFNPRLDLRTRRIIQGVEARVNVTGTLREPNIMLSSTPPLDEADILSLIVFNQPLNELGEGQQISLAARAQSIAAGAVVGQLAQSIGNALELDTFEVNLAPESGRGPELTIGQQVGQNLYVKVRQDLADMGTMNVILEYELNKWLRLQTNILQGTPAQQSMFRRAASTGADLLFFFSY